MAYRRLVVNGCSYMAAYASGGGHRDLAEKLGIPEYHSLAIGGSANSRILRTTLKHSYQQDEPNFYILGLTFLSRLELPILENQTDFEGRWTNPQNQQFKKNWQRGWSEQDTLQFVDLKIKSEVFSILDRTEDLMYRIISVIHDLKSRGHGVVVYQQADSLHQEFLTDPKLELFKTFPEIIDGYAWRAVSWQFEQGVPAMHYGAPIHQVPADQRHPAPGHHARLNEFLQNYILKHQLL